MRKADNWTDYELIDCSDGERLERWGDIILVRPDPQVIWKTPKENPLWYNPHAIYNRSNTGGGSWRVCKKMPDVWQIGFENLKFNIKTMGFKHTGLFPEQAVNWKMTADIIKNAGRPVKVLNLFAYTGGATVAALNAGASVTHVDASKGMTLWAKENAAASKLSDAPVRWLVDDCKKFVEREIRRGNHYDAIIMDPPSYGRGPSGEVSKIEDSVDELISLSAQLLSKEPLFFLVNSYTTGLSASAMKYITDIRLLNKYNGKSVADEIGLPVKRTGLALPCGSSVRVTFSKE